MPVPIKFAFEVRTSSSHPPMRTLLTVASTVTAKHRIRASLASEALSVRAASKKRARSSNKTYGKVEDDNCFDVLLSGDTESRSQNAIIREEKR